MEDQNLMKTQCMKFVYYSKIQILKTQDVADKFNISLSQVQKIRCGIAWKHIWRQYSIKVNKRTTNPND